MVLNDPDHVAREDLVSYMKQYRPEKVDRVDKILNHFKGRHGALRKDLKAKYGAEPKRSDKPVFGGRKESSSRQVRFPSNSKQTPMPETGGYDDYQDDGGEQETIIVAGHHEDVGLKGYKPSHDEASRYRRNHILPQWVLDPITNKKRRATLGEHGYVYNVFSTPTMELMHFGMGVGLYFRLLVDLGVLLAIVAVFNSSSIRYFASAAYKGKHDAHALAYNFGTAACVPDQVSIGNNATVAHNTCQLEEEQGILNLLSIMFFFLYVVVSRSYYGWLEKRADEEVQSAQDYSVMASNPKENLPPNTSVETALKIFKSYFEHVGGSDSDVAFLTVAVDNRKLLELMTQFMELKQQYKMSTGKEIELTGDQGPIRPVDRGCCTSLCPAFSRLQEEFMDTLTGLFSQKTEEQWRRKFGQLKSMIKTELDDCDAKNGYDITKVYVTYMKESSQRRCLERLVNNPNDFKFRVDKSGELVTSLEHKCTELPIPTSVDRGDDNPSWTDSIPFDLTAKVDANGRLLGREDIEQKAGFKIVMDEKSKREVIYKNLTIHSSRPLTGDSVLVDSDGKVVLEKKNDGSLLSDGVEVQKASKLHVSEACEPSDVFWGKLGPSGIMAYLRAAFRKFFVLIACAALIWAGTFAVDVTKRTLIDDKTHEHHNEGPLFVGLIISSFNFILPGVMKVITSFEDHATHSSMQSSLVIKLLTVRCVNSAFINFHITDYTKTLDQTSILTVQWILVSDMVFTPLLHFIDPVGILKRVVFSRLATTQDRLNHLYSGTHWDLADRYTDMIKTLFVAMFYSVLMPHGLWLAAAAMLSTYWADKYCLLRCWSQKPDFDATITKIAQNSICFCMLIQMFMATYWISGYPFDDACKVHGKWEQCDREGKYDDPANWFFPKVRDDMTEAQKAMVGYYSVTNVTMFIIVFVTLYFFDVWNYIKRDWIGVYSNTTRMFNDDYCNVPRISAFVPMIQKQTWDKPMLACPLIADREKICFDVEYKSSYEEYSIFDSLEEILESDERYFGRERSDNVQRYFSKCEQYYENQVHRESSARNDMSAVSTGSYGPRFEWSNDDRFGNEDEQKTLRNPFKKKTGGDLNPVKRFVDYLSGHTCYACIGVVILIGVFVIGCLAVAYQHLCDHQKQLVQDGLCTSPYCLIDDIPDHGIIGDVKLTDLQSQEGVVTIYPAWGQPDQTQVSVIASMFARNRNRAAGLVGFNSSVTIDPATDVESYAVEAKAEFGTTKTMMGYDVDCKHVSMAVEMPLSLEMFGALNVEVGLSSSIDADMATEKPDPNTATSSADGTTELAYASTSFDKMALTSSWGPISVQNFRTSAHGYLSVRTEKDDVVSGAASVSLHNLETKTASIQTNTADVTASNIRLLSKGVFNITSTSGSIYLNDVYSLGDKSDIFIETDTGDILITLNGRFFHGRYNLQSKDGQVWTDPGSYFIYRGGAPEVCCDAKVHGCKSWQGLPTLRDDIRFEHDHCKQGRVGFSYGQQNIIAYSRTGNVTLRVR
jgi:hypothetical protein